MLGVLLGLFAGLRIGEICTLKLGDIDLSEQLVHIDKTMFRIRNPDDGSPKTLLITDTPKSASSVRSVPILPFMLGALTRLKHSHPDGSYFLSGSAVPIEPRTYTERYKAFLNRLNIPYRKFHSLRHTYATECIKHGVDVKSLSELLGHSSVKITLDRYVHSDMKMKRLELEKLYNAI
ncbi:Phage integrase family protein [Ruminococcaceae bacterium FB2012]|nr:Phage integrase family protein [Ruminococcaceae bacterium FB2012]